MDKAVKRYQRIAEKLFDITGGFIGYLVPGLDNERKVERTLLRASDGRDLHRPFGWAEFDMDTGAMLFYKSCISEDFIDTELYPLSTLMSQDFVIARSMEEQAEYEERLWNSYLEIRAFAFEQDLTEEQKAKMHEYQELWNLTLLKDLAVYYQALSPEFFEWLSV